uniref:Uncharacterized protein n=1 Tax=Arundo donax TaxID=35708 RepID=A0A0A9ATS8_ARUDO
MHFRLAQSKNWILYQVPFYGTLLRTHAYWVVRLSMRQQVTSPG